MAMASGTPKMTTAAMKVSKWTNPPYRPDTNHHRIVVAIVAPPTVVFAALFDGVFGVGSPKAAYLVE